MALPIDVSTIKTLEDQFLACASQLQIEELKVPSDTRPNNITVVPDAEAQVVTVTATIPATFSRNGSSFITVASPYLL